MPIKIVCSNCGFVLYSKSELIAPEEIVKKFGTRCPRCLAKLVIKPNRVVVISKKS